MTPLGWTYALAVWGYALAWFLVKDLVKVEVSRLMHLGTAGHQRHVARVNAHLHPAAAGKPTSATA
jgi:H+-transporting ATPase